MSHRGHVPVLANPLAVALAMAMALALALAIVGSQLRHVISINIYIAPLVPVANTSCFTRQTTSHPAHTSNLGKVSTVPYRIRGTKKESGANQRARMEDSYWYCSICPTILLVH
jgi:hypothetical protein